MLYSFWNAEKSFDEFTFIKEFPMYPASTIHLRLLQIFWLALLLTKLLFTMDIFDLVASFQPPTQPLNPQCTHYW